MRSESLAWFRCEGALRYGVGPRGLRQNDVESGHVVVPLDESRLWTEMLKRAGVERPDRLGNPAAMGVDENLAAAVLRLRCEAAQMQLCDGVSRQLSKVTVAIEAKIVRAQIDVADIAQ